METKVRQITHAAEIEITNGPHAGQVVAVPFNYAPDAELVGPAIVELVGALSTVQHVDALHDATELYLATPAVEVTQKLRNAAVLMAAVLELVRAVKLDVCRL